MKSFYEYPTRNCVFKKYELQNFSYNVKKDKGEGMRGIDARSYHHVIWSNDYPHWLDHLISHKLYYP